MNKKLYIKHLLKQYRPFMILSYFLCLWEPLQMLIGGFGKDFYDMDIKKDFYLKLYYTQMNLPTLAMILSIVMAFVVFKHLYNKSDLDNYWSVPAKRSDFFLAHFFTGYVFLLALPISSAYILNSLIQYIQAYSILAGSVSIIKLISGLSLLLLNTFSFYVPTVLAIVLTTSMFNGFIVAVTFQLFFPIVQLICVAVVESDPTLLSVYENIFMNFYWLNLPLTHISYFIPLINDNLISVYPMLAWGLVSLGLFFITMHLHDKRKVEKIGSSDMFKGFYQTLILIFGTLIITFGIITFMPVTSASLKNPGDFLPLFISNLITFFIVQIARWHGKPPIIKSCLAYICIFVLSMVISLVITGPLKNHIIMTQPKAEDIGRIEILNPVDTRSDYYKLLNIGNFQHNKSNSVQPHSDLVLGSRPQGYVDPETGMPLDLDSDLSEELNPKTLNTNYFDAFSYECALQGAFPSGAPMFKSSDQVTLAPEHGSKRHDQPADGKINMQNLQEGKASQDPKYFRSKNLTGSNSYSFNYFTDRKAIEGILNFERKSLEKYVRKNSDESAYPSGIFLIKPGPDGPSQYSIQFVYIRVLAYNRKGKLIKAREFSVSDKEDLKFLDKIFNNKLFYLNGAQYKE